ncbi:MAG: histidine--tRNA ligase [Actinomycetota bacterium]|nr:histidine--tRNA ligase [Actinomycetota bacterium]MDD5665975.1 histidine--tRNA ligase [Actinomycetota bacterium]
MDVKAPKGTADILPPDSEDWRRVVEKGTALFRTYGYREIMLPVMEHTEVFARGIGQGTDIVQKEMFTFTDKGGRSLTLRPEATAGVARAFIQHRLDAAGLPVKLYYRGPMFRHERPQAGRYRQFRQLGVELIGSPYPAADAEVIVLCAGFFSGLEIETDLAINSVGDDECRPAYVEALRKYLGRHEGKLCGDCRRRAVENPLRVLDCKVEGCAEVIAAAPTIEDYLCGPCREHQGELEDLLRAVSLPFRRDGRLVRGLDYYTRTVFEFQDPKLGGQNALAAGGRYDNLVKELGGKPTPATGFSIGMERVMLAGPRQEGRSEDGVFVVAIGETARGKAFLTAQGLRGAGIRADLDHLRRSPKAQMREADRGGFAFSVIIGEDELAGGYYTLRNMSAATQERVEEAELLETLRRRLDESGA